MITYQSGNDMGFQQRIYQRPDSPDISLVNDYDKQVLMSTFIDKKTLLLQLNNRYMIFDHNGNFVDECNFSDYKTGSRYSNNMDESLNKMVLSKFSDNSLYYIFLD